MEELGKKDAEDLGGKKRQEKKRSQMRDPCTPHSCSTKAKGGGV